MRAACLVIHPIEPSRRKAKKVLAAHHEIDRQVGDTLAESTCNSLTRVKPIMRLNDDKCRAFHPCRIATEEPAFATLYIDLYNEEFPPWLHIADLGDAVSAEVTFALDNAESVGSRIWIGDAQPRHLVPDRSGERRDLPSHRVSGENRKIFAIWLDGIDFRSWELLTEPHRRETDIGARIDDHRHAISRQYRLVAIPLSQASCRQPLVS